MKILFLTSSYFHPDDSERDALIAEFDDIQLTTAPSASYHINLLGDAQIIVGSPKPRDLVHATKLRWLQTPSSGVGQYLDKRLFANEDIIITNARGTYGPEIADHVLGMVIGFNHHLFCYHYRMKGQVWKGYVPQQDLSQSTILIIGFGDIGTNLAKRAKAHGLRTVVVKRSEAEKPPYVDELHTIGELDTLLGAADHVVLCAASTTETEHLMDATRLALMKKTAYLYNVARGSLVDEAALIEALRRGQIAGSGLDVTAVEPLPAESPLWTLPNVLITPHASGLSRRNSHAIFNLFVENLRGYRSGTAMKNVVDFVRGY